MYNLYSKIGFPCFHEIHSVTQGSLLDLMFSEWNDWSTCSVTCGKGTSLRARICLVTSCSQKDLFQTKSCQRSICAGTSAIKIKWDNGTHTSRPEHCRYYFNVKLLKLVSSSLINNFSTFCLSSKRQGRATHPPTFLGLVQVSCNHFSF